MIKENRYYTFNNNDLLVRIDKIFYYNDRYIRAACSIYHKRILCLYEQKTYKLNRQLTEIWEEVDKVTYE